MALGKSDPDFYSGAFGFDFCDCLKTGSHAAQVGFELPM